MTLPQPRAKAVGLNQRSVETLVRMLVAHVSNGDSPATAEPHVLAQSGICLSWQPI